VAPRLNGGGGNDDDKDGDEPPAAVVTKVCGVPEVRTAQFLPADSEYHRVNVGAANGKAWRSTGANVAGFATFGPYLRNVPTGVIRVTFRLKLTTTQPLDNAEVADIDVFSLDNRGTFLAGRTIRRFDFNQSGVAQDFSMIISNRAYCDRGMEFRLFWKGKPANDPANTSTILDHESTTYEALGTSSIGFSNLGSQLPLQFHLFDNLVDKTVAVWVKTTGVSGAIFGTDNVGYPNIPTAWVPAVRLDSAGKVRSCFWAGANVNCENISAVAVNDGRWHHVVVTSEGSTQRLYIDGALSSTRTNATPAPSQAIRAQWGLGYTLNWSGSTSLGWEQFVGEMRDPMMLSTNLSAAEVADLYGTTRP